MKQAIVIVSLFVAALAYTDLDDSFNFDNWIADKATFQDDLECLIDRKPCRPVMVQYRNHASEAVSDACNECNDIEKHDLVVFIKALKNYPEQYKIYQSMFDPQGTNIPAIENKLSSYVKYKA